MTKAKMIETLRDREARLWLEAVEYRAIMTKNMTEEERENWLKTDPMYIRRNSRWVAVSNLLDDMGIEADFEHPANERASRIAMHEIEF